MSDTNHPTGRTAWWLDYVEGELDPSTRAEMKAILRHSKKDQEVVEALSETKQLLERNEEELPIMGEDFFDNLESKIMAQVEKTEIAPTPTFQLRAQHRYWMKVTGAGAASLLMVFALFSYFSHKSLNTRWDVPTQMAQQGHENPDEMALVMTYQSEHDFFVDVASQSFDHLTKEQFESLMETKTR